MPPERSSLAVVGLSARWLAEAARDSGWSTVHALDAFGDRDTQDVAARWWDIGAADEVSVDPQRLEAALASLAGDPSVQGWIDGPGCEAWLCGPGTETTPASLPRWGAPRDAIRRLRNAELWLQALDRLDLPHPESRLDPPSDRVGWLRKDLMSSGGQGVLQAAGASRSRGPGVHWQRQAQGQPWSLCFVAGVDGIRVLGAQRLLHAPVADRPWAFIGLQGPEPMPPAVFAAWSRAASELSRWAGLRGLASLDGLIDAQTGRWQLLELNPRPSASLQLYRPWPVLRWHVEACLGGGLPELPNERPAPRLWRIVHAPRAMWVDPEDLASWCPAGNDARHLLRVHDRPDGSARRWPAGAPLCSLSLAPSADAAGAAETLRGQEHDLLKHLDPTFDPSSTDHHEPAGPPPGRTPQGAAQRDPRDHASHRLAELPAQ